MGDLRDQRASRRRRVVAVAALLLTGVVAGAACGTDEDDRVGVESTSNRRLQPSAEDPEERDAATSSTVTTAPTATAPTTTTPTTSAAANDGDPVDLLRIEPESDGGVDYDRDLYGGWTTGSDGCRTRDTVLIRDARPPGAQVDPSGCTVLAGEWTDPYTNETVVADDRSEVGDLVHVDHVVALAEAHRSGGWRWGRALRRDFANDLDNLLATAASVNVSKSDRGPASWQPPATDRWCAFTEVWILAKVRWDLAADGAEADALRNMRSARDCPDDFVDPA